MQYYFSTLRLYAGSCTPMPPHHSTLTASLREKQLLIPMARALRPRSCLWSPKKYPYKLGIRSPYTAAGPSRCTRRSWASRMRRTWCSWNCLCSRGLQALVSRIGRFSMQCWHANQSRTSWKIVLWIQRITWWIAEAAQIVCLEISSIPTSAALKPYSDHVTHHTSGEGLI